MKTTILSIAIAAAFTCLAAAETIPERTRNQRNRIEQGARSGQLTRPETAALARQQQAIHNQIQRDRRDGAGMTAAERARAQARLANASRDIARLKHNNRTR